MKITFPITKHHCISSLLLLSFWSCGDVTSSNQESQYSEQPIDTSIVDSAEIAQGKITQEDFDLNYNAPAWFREYKSNKVVFDKNYKDRTIDIHGVIEEISTEWGCAVIKLDAGEGYFESIRLSNCPQNKDKWSKEVEKVVVGEEIHVRGKYNSFTSDNTTLDVHGCHIVKKIPLELAE